MGKGSSLAVATLDGGLVRYLSAISKFPLLDAQEEYILSKRYREHEDAMAAEQLVTSHLRLVARVAMSYCGYGLPVSEIISEGNIGLMQAVKRFDPDRGFRLATYALWWIKAAIKEYILRSWSLVKIGTTAAQKRLFFNLRRAKSKLNAFNDTSLQTNQVDTIASDLGVSQAEVMSMNQRLCGDASLNAQLGVEDTGLEWQDCIVDNSPNQEVLCEEQQLLKKNKDLLNRALTILNKRECCVFKARRLVENQFTLEALGKVLGISRERVRQIDARAFEKVKAFILSETLEEKRAVADAVDRTVIKPRVSL